ncbi:regulator [Peribacillus cavernae]|uniref:Regulator n=1 Tax=Peribacillus cavernae TaxID=1674310 RepID=A0A433HHS0_9BACI|nr:intercompartmental signaling factor BofC [Peribacillus cavernae]MDQ0219347.1 forespore regulator of the sigma-K checkpoint [Peribacillus cavernae]RUQ27775.1 regulator [Peribacillus cavernae]
MKGRLAFLTLLVSVTLASIFWTVTVSGEEKQEKTQQITGPLERKVILQRVYVDGEMSEETVVEKIQAMEDFWASYRDWQLIDQNEERIIFQKTENDISPLLKANGFFGLTEDGTLSIFNGKPDHSQIIQSFFQIDVRKLESYKQKELQKGIPILNRNRYQQMIEAYKPYSLRESYK